MIVPIKTANLLAKYACPKWNHGDDSKVSRVIHGILRRTCRYLFWGLAMADYYLFAPSSPLRVSRYADRTKYGNTYPRVFRTIANWKESLDALVVDPANFVIKYATSYCAWKIFELTGKWPTKKVKPRDKAHAQKIADRERAHDAKYWLEFLQAQTCYRDIVDEDYIFQNYKGHYIGIDTNYGEYGLVVWFEYCFIERIDEQPMLMGFEISTYENKQFVHKTVPLRQFTWIEIGKRAAR